MGIDIYMDWNGFTEDDKNAQLKGFDTTIGNTGYLREAYHGEPYVTRYLLREAFDEDPDQWVSSDENSDDYRKVRIPSEVLQKRLPEAIKLALRREKEIYQGTDEQAKERAQSFIDFVELHRRMEKEGRDPKIYASF